MPPIASGSSVKVPVQLEIQNVGGGRAFLKDTTPSSDNIDKIKLTEEAKGPITAICTKDSDGNVRLTGGKSRIVSCTLTFNSVTAGSKATATLGITLDYDYFIETTTSVTVLKEVK